MSHIPSIKGLLFEKWASQIKCVLSYYWRHYCVNKALLCRQEVLLTRSWPPTPCGCARETPGFTLFMYCAHSVGTRGGLPSLLGHCRCHTEKEDERISISTEMSIVLLSLQKKKKKKTNKGNQKT